MTMAKQNPTPSKGQTNRKANLQMPVSASARKYQAQARPVSP
jgi:hypothetical protein